MKKSSSHPFDAQKQEQWQAFIQTLSPDADPQTIRLMGQMRMVAHALYQVGENSLMAAELSYAQYRLLMSLLFGEQNEACQALNPSEISQRLGTSRNTISALIRSLEQEGLIERLLDKRDRRKFNIRLTERGRARVCDHAGRHFTTISQCFSSLNREEQQTLSQLLEKLGQAVMSQELN